MQEIRRYPPSYLVNANVVLGGQKDLAVRFTDVNLVVPAGEQHMYWAAMNSKSRKLTPFGKRYWRLGKHNRV